jgi:hypothetical protein
MDEHPILCVGRVFGEIFSCLSILETRVLSILQVVF